tara:strand:+ start:580 stop:825 length:246 start_codon:yes stop_codon:yes gene_type:complete
MKDNRMSFLDYMAVGLLFLVALLAASCSDEESQIVCLAIYDPVCADGKIYTNECFAMKEGYDNRELTKPECTLNTAGCKCL